MRSTDGVSKKNNTHGVSESFNAKTNTDYYLEDLDYSNDHAMSSRANRLRRAVKTRARIKRQRAHRLCVFRSPRHVYAQIIEPSAGQVLVSASTAEREVREQITYGGNVNAAAVVGKRLAEKARDAGIHQVA